jgi:ADP-heptose:LPS heptosyltransferase
LQFVIPNQDITISAGTYPWTFVRPKSARDTGTYKLGADEIYVVPDNVAYQHRDKFKIVKVDPKQCYIPATWDIKQALESDVTHPRLLIMHGTGSGYGDILSGVYAMDALKALFKKHGKTLQITALCREIAMDHYFDVCRIRDSFDEVIPFAVKLQDLTRYHWIISTESLLSEKEFNEMNFYDYWVQRFGMNPDDVDKRTSIAPSPKVMEAVKKQCEALKQELGEGDPFCIYNVFASRLRCIAPRARTRLLEALAEKYRILLISNSTDADEMKVWMEGVSEEVKARVTDLSYISGKGWDYATGILRYMADLVVTPDTGILHLAGILNIPTVGIFFTIEPDLRIRYFPRCEGYVQEEWRTGPFWGESKAKGDKQRAIMEQVNLRDMDPDYVEMWDAFECGEVLELCEKVIGTTPVPSRITGYRKGSRPRVAVYSYDTRSQYFDDRLPLMLLPQVLPADCEVDWYEWRPYRHIPLSKYDLVVFGAGGGLTPPILRQPGLIELIRAAKTSIGVFGVEQRTNVDLGELQGFLGAFSHWFARSKSDIEFTDRSVNISRHRVSHLGWWGLSLWPMQQWQYDDTLTIADQCREAHQIDHAMYDVPSSRRVISHHVEAMVCALCGAEEVKYVEALEGENGKPKVRPGGFAQALEDIFGRSVKSDRWFKVSQKKVQEYKHAVRSNMDAMRQTIGRLLKEA